MDGQVHDVIVIGGGAAGIVAAWRAASRGLKVQLLEKTPRLGTKISISGGGKCNITHAGDIRHILKAFRKNEAEFLRPSMYRFTNEDFLQLLTDEGLEVYTRPDGRIFPTKGNAKDVVRILENHLQRVKVKVVKECRVTGLEVHGGQIQGVFVGDKRLAAKAVIVAAGGSSYPGSGTTGDGWKWLAECGHTIVKPRAALAPIHLRLDQEGELLPPDVRSGVALRDCILKARQNGKELARWRDDLLLTHHGVSGPTALGISREVAEAAGKGAIYIEADTLPNEPYEEVNERWKRWMTAEPKKRIGTLLGTIVPERVVPSIGNQASVPLDKPTGQMSTKERNRLVEALKAWRAGEVRDVPIEKGEVTAGGVELSEVDPHTMQSRLVKGLFLCGEVLDVAGPVGGYNLQAAWSTGYVAGDCAVSEEMA